MIVTINTDASYRYHNGKGGYAFWIVCNIGKMLKSGKIKEPLGSLDCEIKAIANALYLFGKSDLNNGVSRLIINTDCRPAILQVKRKSKFKAGRYVHSRIKSLKKEYREKGVDLQVIFRHVKAHSDIKDARSWVNDWCDKEAKKHSK